MGGPSGRSSALLVERELFAQEGILARERALDRNLKIRKRNKSANRFSQSRQDFIMDRCRRFSISYL